MTDESITKGNTDPTTKRPPPGPWQLLTVLICTVLLLVLVVVVCVLVWCLLTWVATWTGALLPWPTDLAQP